MHVVGSSTGRVVVVVVVSLMAVCVCGGGGCRACVRTVWVK